MPDKNDEVYESRLQGRCNLINERRRLGLDFKDIARLTGLSEERYRSVEFGAEDVSIDICKYLAEAGFDPLFVLGLSDEPASENVKGSSRGLCFKADPAFADTFLLLLKSKQAVDAVFGDGMAEREPALVKTFMESILLQRREKMQLTASNRQLKELSLSIHEIGGNIAQAIRDTRQDTD